MNLKIALLSPGLAAVSAKKPPLFLRRAQDEGNQDMSFPLLDQSSACDPKNLSSHGLNGHSVKLDLLLGGLDHLGVDVEHSCLPYCPAEPPACTPDLPAGLQHLWSGEGNANDSNCDTCVHGVPLLGAAGTIQYTPPSICGQAFQFDITPSNLVKFDLDIRPITKPKITVGMWVNIAASQDGNAWALTNDDGGYDRGVILKDFRYSNGISSSAGSNPALDPTIKGAGDINPNSWECVAVTWDQTNSKAFSYRYDPTTDNLSVSTEQATSFDESNSLTSFTLGGSATFPGDNIIGLIDEVFMYDIILDEDAIKTACKEVIKCKPSGCFNFDPSAL